MADELLSELVKRAATEHAQVVDPPAKPNALSKSALLTYLAGTGADVGSTLYNFTRGGHEANPLINFAGDKAAIPIGLGMEAGAVLLGHKLLKHHPTLFHALLTTAGVAHGVAAVNNLRQRSY